MDDSGRHQVHAVAAVKRSVKSLTRTLPEHALKLVDEDVKRAQLARFEHLPTFIDFQPFSAPGGREPDGVQEKHTLNALVEAMQSLLPGGADQSREYARSGSGREPSPRPDLAFSDASAVPVAEKQLHRNSADVPVAPVEKAKQHNVFALMKQAPHVNARQKPQSSRGESGTREKLGGSHTGPGKAAGVGIKTPVRNRATPAGNAPGGKERYRDPVTDPVTDPVIGTKAGSRLLRSLVRELESRAKAIQERLLETAQHDSLQSLDSIALRSRSPGTQLADRKQAVTVAGPDSHAAASQHSALLSGLTRQVWPGPGEPRRTAAVADLSSRSQDTVPTGSSPLVPASAVAKSPGSPGALEIATLPANLATPPNTAADTSTNPTDEEARVDGVVMANRLRDLLVEQAYLQGVDLT